MHIIVLVFILLLPGSEAAARTDLVLPCGPKDGVCAELERLAVAGKHSAIVAKDVPGAAFSEAARQRIGLAYLEMAAQEGSTADQEEAYCRKAVEFGLPQGYMGLYFVTVQRDPARALGYLREYVATGTADAVPYVILGEDALDRRDYPEADRYLRNAKLVSRARSARVDWMLFHANYQLGEYRAAAAFLGEALRDERFAAEWKELRSDKRFSGIEDRPEFRSYLSTTPADR